jgi:hypothetical protein
MNDETLTTLVHTNKALAAAMHDMLLQLYASQTLVTALLGVLAQDAQGLPALAREISRTAEQGHGVALGCAMDDQHLRERNQVLQGMLPAALRGLVVLPNA